jgi:site-specific recombinase XerD
MHFEGKSTVMDDFTQLSMFGEKPQAPQEEKPEGELPLDPDTPFAKTVEFYLAALKLSGASPHTIKAFKSDLHLLGSWAGEKRAIGSLGTGDLNKFLHWMLTERGIPCSPKTYARRVTTLKNFFSYLYEERAIAKDPANAIIQKPVSSPLPKVLFTEDVEQALLIAQSMRTDREKPDARPLLLITLLLQTGIKKSECVELAIRDVDRSDPKSPFIWIRYANPKMRYKERKISVAPEWLKVLDEYLAQRQPKGRVFDCTARNLEYVLRDVADAAGVSRERMSFETLRWTSALRDYQNDMPPDQLRQKLGLSRISWRETSSKLARLARTTENEDEAEAS